MNGGPELKKQLAELRNGFRLLRLSDQVRWKHELDRAASAAGRGQEGTAELLDSLSARFRKVLDRSLVPVAESLRYEFPEDLPITSHVESIREKLKENQVVIVCGSTGSGKTTQLPKVALAAGCGRLGRIGCTQRWPRGPCSSPA